MPLSIAHQFIKEFVFNTTPMPLYYKYIGASYEEAFDSTRLSSKFIIARVIKYEL
jgi:hypothetical protein